MNILGEIELFRRNSNSLTLANVIRIPRIFLQFHGIPGVGKELENCCYHFACLLLDGLSFAVMLS